VAESSGRMLPQISDNNEFFWKSGEDGKLRFQRCSDCGELRHPPSAVCPYCGSHDWAPAEVSGRAVVAGFGLTVLDVVGAAGAVPTSTVFCSIG